MQQCLTLITMGFMMLLPGCRIIAFAICCLFQGNEIRPQFRPLPLGRTDNVQCAFSVSLAFSTFVLLGKSFDC